MDKKFHTISKEDLDLFQVVDTTEEAMKYILKNVDRDNSIQI